MQNATPAPRTARKIAQVLEHSALPPFYLRHKSKKKTTTVRHRRTALVNVDCGDIVIGDVGGLFFAVRGWSEGKWMELGCESSALKVFRCTSV